MKYNPAEANEGREIAEEVQMTRNTGTSNIPSSATSTHR